MNHTTATSYAKYLATYIASPTKIESLVKLEYDRAPALHVIAQMRVKVEQDARRVYCDDPAEALRDRAMDKDFAVRSLVSLPRVRDYIRLAEPAEPIALKPEVPADNPFIGMVSVTKRLARSVSLDFDIPADVILGKSRKNRVVDARAVVINLLRKRGVSYPEIGRRVGRDHSTVIHAVEHFDIYCRRNEAVAASWERHLKLIEEAELVARGASGELLSDEPTEADFAGSPAPVDNVA